MLSSGSYFLERCPSSFGSKSPVCFLFFYLAFPESDNYISQGADELTSKERGAFIGGAIVETLFFLISSVGYVLRGKHIYTDH